ncbi:hypothetical protein NPS01_14060 [Nocardioides psychrotolerans]|nr:hypothetical protein NPS01_14060 [Nocardioides psychrotolerans]
MRGGLVPDVGRWPVHPRGKTWYDDHLTAMIEACGATAIRLGNGPGELFRTRHGPCGAVVDVTLTMIRCGGWVCQWCRRAAPEVRFAALPVKQRPRAAETCARRRAPHLAMARRHLRAP